MKKQGQVEDNFGRRLGREARIPDDDDNQNNVPENRPAAAAAANIPYAAAPPVPAVAASVESPPNGPADYNDQQDTESLAASDVAVAGRPSQKGKSRKRSRNIDNANGSSRKRPAAEVSLTYPKPKNFVERLMGALQANLAPDCLGWAGDGMAVCLNQKHLKRGDIMSSHFHVSNFGSFKRNLNRWGFRRVSHIPVADGMITYQNSLFRRDEPQLVKQMRMDSESQQMYGRRPDDRVPESIEFSDIDRQNSPPLQEAEDGLLPHQQQLIQWLNGSGWNSQGSAPQLPQMILPQQPPSPQQGIQALQQQSNPMVASIANLLAQALGETSAQQAIDSAKDSMYNQIIALSRQYLALSTVSSSVNTSIVLVLKLLQAFDSLSQQQQASQDAQNNPQNSTVNNMPPVSAAMPQQSNPAESNGLDQSALEMIQRLLGQAQALPSQETVPSQEAPSQAEESDPSVEDSAAERLRSLLRLHGATQHYPTLAPAPAASTGSLQPPALEGPQDATSQRNIDCLLPLLKQQQQQQGPQANAGNDVSSE